jgi:hypothetical protein
MHPTRAGKPVEDTDVLDGIYTHASIVNPVLIQAKL